MHTVGRKADLPKLIAAIKAEKRVLKCEADKAKQKAMGEKSEKSAGKRGRGGGGPVPQDKS